jgi:predicted phage terminase large subunit-like protein
MKKIRITEEQVLGELCRRSFYRFFLEFWDVLESETLVDNWHIQAICDELQEVAERVIRREPRENDIVINVPPGTSKSTIVTVMFPAWLWIRDASLRIISTSYSSALSINHAIKSRDLIKSDKYQKMFDLELKEDQAGKSHYKNTKGGERIATSTGGTVTGFHAHFIILDDPLNPKEAESDAERKTANDYIQSTLNTRKVDKNISVTILVMQRLHDDDPTAKMLEKKKVKHICLPAELGDGVKPVSWREYYTNGLLDPIRMGKDTLADMKRDLGSYGYAGQFMQQPSPASGGIWKKEWFNVVPNASFPERLESLGTDWDLAYTKNMDNSASAWVVAGLLGTDIYIQEVGWDWLEFPQLIHTMRAKQAPHFIEKKASGKSAKQTMDSEGINAIEVDATTDKIARARMASPTAEAGRVYIKESEYEKLLYDEKQGILKFPNAKNDDVADALSQSLIRLSNTFKFVIL